MFIFDLLYLCEVRFGEESLHSCEVMLKDIEDSRRANNAVHSELTRAAAATATASNSTVSNLLALFCTILL